MYIYDWLVVQTSGLSAVDWQLSVCMLVQKNIDICIVLSITSVSDVLASMLYNLSYILGCIGQSLNNRVADNKISYPNFPIALHWLWFWEVKSLTHSNNSILHHKLFGGLPWHEIYIIYWCNQSSMLLTITYKSIPQYLTTPISMATWHVHASSTWYLVSDIHL